MDLPPPHHHHHHIHYHGQKKKWMDQKQKNSLPGKNWKKNSGQNQQIFDMKKFFPNISGWDLWILVIRSSLNIKYLQWWWFELKWFCFKDSKFSETLSVSVFELTKHQNNFWVSISLSVSVSVSVSLEKSIRSNLNRQTTSNFQWWSFRFIDNPIVS